MYFWNFAANLLSFHPPVFKFPFVVIELYTPRMLHTPHNVDHILLVDAHLEGVDRGPFDVEWRPL